MTTVDLLHLIKKEEQLIACEVERTFCSIDNLQPLSSFDIGLINENLTFTDNTNIAIAVHNNLMYSLIRKYISSRFREHIVSLGDIFQFDQTKGDYEIDVIDVKSIPKLLESLHTTFLNSVFEFTGGGVQRKKSKHYLKEAGAVYTLSQIANQIVKKTISNSFKHCKSIDKITCLDFACGTGRFYFEALKTLNEQYDISIHDIICNNLFAVDIDKTALAVLRCKILSYLTNVDTDIISALSNNIIHRNALIPKATIVTDFDNCIDFSNDFRKVFDAGGFDVVFSNPPYYLLKVNRKETSEGLESFHDRLQQKIQKEITFFRTSGTYLHSIEGMLNYYQLSIEMILRFTKANGEIGIICPSSIFADLTSAKLRKHLLTSNHLHFIRYYPEAAKLFENVSQSTVIFYLRKGGTSNNIEIEMSDSSFQIDFSTIKRVFPVNFEIPLIDKIGWDILSKISCYRKLRELTFVRNRRGELDLTLFKSFITTQDTGYRLIRGNMIKDNGIINKNAEFVVIDKFLAKKSDDFKQHDFNKSRLICQQISNIDIQRRLKFIFCKETDILGNSCNYIVSKRGNTDLEKLFYILNSNLLNWRFKITSSNNHINNYELDELPIIDLDAINLNEFTDDEIENDRKIGMLYGLNDEELNYLNTGRKKTARAIEYEHETV